MAGGTLLLPATGKPRLSTLELERLLQPYDLDRIKHPVAVVGVRGYYRNTMGAPGVNDRGIYDDAIFLHSPSAFAAFNANTDPSAYRKGQGQGAGRGMASLESGMWLVYQFDKHKGKYLALCQRSGPVTVVRDGNPPYKDTGYFGINIHRGGFTSTSSEGCQTIHPAQWVSFIGLAQDHRRGDTGGRAGTRSPSRMSCWTTHSSSRGQVSD